MRKAIDESKWPLNTIKPLFRAPRMLHKIHRLQGAKLGMRISIPGVLAWAINNDVTASEICDRCHQPHGAFLNAFPPDNRPADRRARGILLRGLIDIYGLRWTDSFYKIYRWDGRQLVENETVAAAYIQAADLTEAVKNVVPMSDYRKIDKN